MASEFIRKKYLRAFETFDRDASGTIERTDFEASAEALATAPDGALDEGKRKSYLDVLLMMWDGLLDADANGDGHVSFDEWAAMWQAYAKDPAGAKRWQKLYCKLSFQLLDAGDDGAIDADEFAEAYQARGFEKKDAVAIFEKLSKGKPSISRDEFELLWKEYFTSEDVDAPGNLLFTSPNSP